MPKLSPPFGSTSRMEGFMTAPSSREVSPTALPNGSPRSSKVVVRYITPRTANWSSTVGANQSRSPGSFLGGPSSSRPKNPILGARTAVVPLSFGGSSVTTLSGHRAFMAWSIPPTVDAPSVELERTTFERLPPQLDRPISILSPISRRNDLVHADRSFTYDPPSSDSNHPTHLGEVVPHRHGRHRGPIHRGVLRSRITRRRDRRASLLSSLRRTVDRLFGRKPLRGKHRAVAALTLAWQPASITSSAQSQTEGMTS